ncbi:MAG: hypothetical protein M1823_000927 [Watsoniomyces obsoletus]|nr:MAG: hypothetical protein M1823_000927 [Watsoniomyces obsoletus]
MSNPARYSNRPAINADQFDGSQSSYRVNRGGRPHTIMANTSRASSSSGPRKQRGGNKGGRFSSAAFTTQAPESTSRNLATYHAHVAENKKTKKRNWDAQKAKKKAERVLRQKRWRYQMKTAQIFLGIRSPAEAPIRAPPGTFLSDVSNTGEPIFAGSQFYGSIVFLSIDLEMLETDNRKITEIGISVLDTLTLEGISPGQDGRNWFSKFNTRHLRIDRYKDHVNEKYVHGCPDKFLFGKSEIVSLNQARRILESIFISYENASYPASLPIDNPFSTDTLLDSLIEEDGGPRTTTRSLPPRRIVLVGHDLHNDLECLRRIDFDPTKMLGYRETIDTADLWRAFKRHLSPLNLEGIMSELGIQAWDAHNAGNDAVYTLQALIVLAFKARGSKRDFKEEKAKEIEVAVQELRERMWDEAEGWSSTDAEDNGNGDGGDETGDEEFFEA